MNEQVAGPLLILTIAIPLAWKVNRVRRQQAAVAEITRLGGRAFYDDGLYPRYTRTPRWRWEPDWLRILLGAEYFDRVVVVHVWGAEVTDETLGLLADLPALENVTLASDRITDEGLLHLSKLSNLRRLDLQASAVTDEGLVYVSRLESLNSLGLNSKAITDKGLEDIATMDQLVGLSISNTLISDRGLGYLHTMAQLRRVDLNNTRVTLDGVVALCEAVPKCHVHGEMTVHGKYTYRSYPANLDMLVRRIE
jgi:hypothetical protein